MTQLRYRDICRLGQVNRYLQSVVQDGHLFQAILKRDFPTFKAEVSQARAIYQREFILRDNLLNRRWEINTYSVPDRSATPVACLLEKEGKLFVCFEDFIQIFDYKTKSWLARLEGCVRGPQGIIEKNGRLYAAAKNHAIGVWNGTTHECLTTLPGHTGAVSCLVQAGDRLYSGAEDGTIRVWDLNTHECLSCLREHEATIKCLMVKDGKLFTGSSDNTIRVWELETFKCCGTLKNHQGPLTTLSENGTSLFSLAKDGRVEEWDPDKLVHKASFTDPTGQRVESLIAVGDNLCMGLANGWISIWNCATRQCVATLQGHTQKVNHLLAKEGKLYSGSDDETVCVWDLANYKKLATSPKHEGSLSCLAESHGKIYSGSGTSVKLWDFYNTPVRKLMYK